MRALPLVAFALLPGLPSFAADPAAPLEAMFATPGERLARAANDDENAAPSEEAEPGSASLPDQEVKVGGEVLGESIGGATGFVFKQGFYTQADVGVYFRLGGFADPQGGDCGGIPCEPVGVSQAQPYIGLSVGYDLLPWLGVQGSFGTGFVANAAHYGNRSSTAPRDYGMTFVDLGVVGQYYIDRVAFAVKVSGGGLLVTPPPDTTESSFGGNVLVGVGVRYATLFPDTFIGVDANFHAAFLPDSKANLQFIPAFSLPFVLKYVF